MSTEVLTQIHSLLPSLSREEKLRLFGELAEQLTGPAPDSTPVVPADFDLDAALQEIRSQWEREEMGMFDLGHQGDVDYTQIRQSLRLTPDQRLDRHEGWRLFVKEGQGRARIHPGDDRSADRGGG